MKTYAPAQSETVELQGCNDYGDFFTSKLSVFPGQVLYVVEESSRHSLLVFAGGHEVAVANPKSEVLAALVGKVPELQPCEEWRELEARREEEHKREMEELVNSRRNSKTHWWARFMERFR